jgi:hypothetical protein
MDVYDKDEHARRAADALNGAEGSRSDDPLDPRSARANSPVDGMTESRTNPPVDDMTETAGRSSREWNRREWAGEAPAGSEPQHWNKNEWAGEPPDPDAEEPGGAMPEGETGPTGLGHNPGEQHWAGHREP